MTSYKYSEGNLLERPQTYFFSQTGGEAFLQSYLKARSNAIADLTEHLALEETNQDRADNWLLAEWREWLQQGADDVIPESILTFLKRFAVTKRVWSDYTQEIRPLPTARSGDFSFYCAASRLCLDVVAARWDLRFLNTALQIDDILIAYRHDLTRTQAALVVASISEEISQVFRLIRSDS